jgi:macrolide-specific efflux system membrane fusion protein
MIIDLKELSKKISRGTPLSINIITKRKENVVVIPPSTLRTIGSRTYVQVVDADGKREVDVEVGQQTATQVEIISGLTPGQKVVGR